MSIFMIKVRNMSTKNPRINVTFAESTLGILFDLAQQNSQSISGLVRELVLEALELREDFYLSKLAEKRDQANIKVYSHDEVWK
jgi:hypothetical protein